MPLDINSDIGICKLALSKLGTNSSMESFTEAGVEASECNLWYNISLKEILSSAFWSFARKRQTLAVHGDDPPAGVWGFRYQYPVDALKLRYLENPTGQTSSSSAFWSQESNARIDGNAGQKVPFEIEISDDGTKSILTNLDSAIGVYTFLQTNVHLFSPEFIEAFSTLLAYHIAPGLTEGDKKTKEMIALYSGVWPIAVAASANESASGPPPEAEWIRGR